MPRERMLLFSNRCKQAYSILYSGTARLFSPQCSAFPLLFEQAPSMRRSWKSFTHTFKLFIDETTCILKRQTVHAHIIVWKSHQLHGHRREGPGDEASLTFAFILCQADVNSTIVVITTSRPKRKLCPISRDSAIMFPSIKGM